MTALTTKTVVGVFADLAQAQGAAAVLRKAGFSAGAISIVTRAGLRKTEDRATDAENNAAVGAAIGGISGLAVSFVTLAVPGIGPALAAGPILAAPGGAGAGVRSC